MMKKIVMICFIVAHITLEAATKRRAPSPIEGDYKKALLEDNHEIKRDAGYDADASMDTSADDSVFHPVPHLRNEDGDLEFEFPDNNDVHPYSGIGRMRIRMERASTPVAQEIPEDLGCLMDPSEIIQISEGILQELAAGKEAHMRERCKIQSLDRRKVIKRSWLRRLLGSLCCCCAQQSD